MTKKRSFITLLLAVVIALAPLTSYRNVVNADTGASYWREMSSSYYYDQLSSAEKEFFDELDSQCMDILLSDDNVWNVEVNVSALGLDIDDVYDLYFLFYWSNPQYFFLDTSIGYYSIGGVYYLDVPLMDSFSDGDSRVEAREATKYLVDEILKETQGTNRPEEKEVIVHDIMCDYIDYVGNDMDQSMISAVMGETVCAGYSMFFEALMNKCGVDCIVVTCEDHAWNMINLYDNWYVVDVTNDDQDYGIDYWMYNTDHDLAETPYDSYMLGRFPDAKYDCLESSYYSDRYVTVDGTTYFIVNDVNNDYGYIAKPVENIGSHIPETISYYSKTYTVIGGSPYIPKDGWIKEDGAWRYYENDVKVTDWKNIGGKWYYFDENGAMLTGWQKLSNKWYYFDASGVMAKGWAKVSGKWYYFSADGSMVTGWKKIDGKYYFFNGNGAMQTGWMQDGGKWYYLKADGSMATGWIKDSGKWYYMNADGSMATGWKKVSGVYYYLETSGAMHTGWLDYNGKTYWLDGDGAMACNTTVEIDGVEYSFDASGACLNL